MKRPDDGIIPFALMVLAALVATGVVAVLEPLWAVGVVAVGTGLVATAYGGLMVVTVCLALGVLGVSGAINAYAPSLEFVPTAAVAYLATLGAGLGIRVIRPRRRGGKLFLPVTVYIGFCLLAAFVTAFSTSSPEFAARGFLALAFPVLTVIAVTGAIARPGPPPSTRRATLVVGTILAVLGANSIVALRQAFLGFTAAELALIRRSDSTYAVGDAIRTMGLLPTNQDFGVLIACLAPATFVAATYLAGKARAVVLTVGTLAAIALVTSLTRTALIAASIALLVGMFAWGAGATISRVSKYGLGIGLSAAAVWYWLSSTTNTRVQETYERLLTLSNLSDDRSYTERSQEVYPQALKIIGDHLLGAGAGSAGPLSQRFSAVAPLGALVTDNGYLMIAVQMGVLGAVAMVWLLWRTMRAVISEVSPVRVAGAVAVLALLVAMVTAQYWSLSAPMSVIAALIGVAFSDARLRRPRHDESAHEKVRV